VKPREEMIVFLFSPGINNLIGKGGVQYLLQWGVRMDGGPFQRHLFHPESCFQSPHISEVIPWPLIFWNVE